MFCSRLGVWVLGMGSGRVELRVAEVAVKLQLKVGGSGECSPQLLVILSGLD
jgi:hypothetical protein